MRFALILFVMCLPGLAQAGLRVCNDTDTGLRVAIGYKADGAWTSEGWWVVDRGVCEMILGKPLDKTFYYYRATPDTGTFARGKFNFCTGPSPFTIIGDSDCEGRGHVTERFHEIALAKGTTRHTLALSQSDLQAEAPTPAPAPVVTPPAPVVAPPPAPVVAPAPARSISDPYAAAPGTHGEPLSIAGLLSHCEVTDAGQQCQIHADGWRYVADLTGPTSVEIIEWLADLPENTPVALRGDLKFYGGTLAEITIREVELYGTDPFAQVRRDLQGFWTSLDDSSYQILFYGGVAEELSGGMFTSTSMVDVAQGCDGAPGAGPFVILRSYGEEEDPRCMSLDLLTANSLELWPVGVMRPLRFTRTD